MRILFCIRPDHDRNIAGDGIQMLQAARRLSQAGHDVRINDGGFDECDAVHLFNITRISETYRAFLAARAAGKPVAVTPTYWDLEKYYSSARNPAPLAEWRANRTFRNAVLNGCRMIFPASRIEADLIRSQYGAGLPVTVVYNGYDPAVFSEGSPAAVVQEAVAPAAVAPPADPFVLCAARVCPRKNQLALAEATDSLGIRLVMAGAASNPDYLKACLEHKNTEWRDFLSPDQLAELYRTASLHALCSFVETPGLSCIEAAACGCGLLVTSEGSATEYFSDLAVYFDPYDAGALPERLRRALDAHNGKAVAERMRQNFTLDRCLAPLEAYYSSLEVRNA